MTGRARVEESDNKNKLAVLGCAIGRNSVLHVRSGNAESLGEMLDGERVDVL
jgi:hypothetical protein